MRYFYPVLFFFIGVFLAGGIGAFFFFSYNNGSPLYSFTLPTPERENDPFIYGAWPALENADFVEKVKNEMKEKKIRFVSANLTEMKLAIYDEGEKILEVPIKSKGREGSWWETPSGLYKAEGKTKNHFSSFGQVYMPWSIPFQGNFFIHGWPYYSDGRPVAEGYSGGCIRLEDEYAEAVYNAIDIHTPILVFEEKTESAFSYIQEVQGVNAEQYIVIDINNATVLAHKSGEKYTTSLPLPLLSAVIASEYQNIEKEIPIILNQKEEGEEKNSRLYREGEETLSLYQLFFPLLMEYDADALTSIRSYFGSQRFKNLLEHKMRAIGMEKSTLIENDSLLSMHTTPEELFFLIKYIHQNRSFLLHISAGTVKTHTYGAPLWNDITPLHPLLFTKGFLGGSQNIKKDILKEENKNDIITLIEMPFHSASPPRPIAFILFNSKTPKEDTTVLIRHIQNLYREK
jgi:hypothetical protein